MRRGKLFFTFCIVITITLFLYGVITLLMMRFQVGDVYPPYSSYRSDPLGTKAFYEALGLLPGVETVRNVKPLTNQSGLAESTILFFGMYTRDFTGMDANTVQAVEDALREGGRIVVTFVPTHAKPPPPATKEEIFEPPQKDAGDQHNGEEKQEPYRTDYINLTERWSVDTELSAETSREAHLRVPERHLPPSLVWHSTLVFKPQDSVWRTIYTMAGRPVLIERSYGKGSIIMASDSFLLSNEAMKSTRYPHLLTWLCGDHDRIIFDETHLGIAKHPGIATLLRKYGLAPFFLALIVLALLAIWKQSFSLVPAHDEAQGMMVNPGKDYVTGLTNLLRRNIPSSNILKACLEEWKRSFTHGKQNFSDQLPRIQKIIAAEQAQPKKNRSAIRAYRKISTLVYPKGSIQSTSNKVSTGTKDPISTRQGSVVNTAQNAHHRGSGAIHRARKILRKGAGK
jgi:hypothetical protein